VSALSDRLEAAARAFESNANVAPVAGQISGTAGCSLAGSVSIDGSYDVTDLGQSFDLTASFDNCHEREGTFDGALQWTEDVTPDSVRETTHGTLDFTDADGAWSCAFDFTLVVDGTGVHYAGTICGYAAAQLDIEN
jgi:hypothetical protein